MRHRFALPTLALLATVLVAGCGDSDTSSDPGGDDTPTSETTSGTTQDAGDDLCHQVSDSDLSEWAKTEVTVRDQDGEAGDITCDTVLDDAFAPVRISWTLTDSEGSLQADADQQNATGLEQQKTTLPGGSDAIIVKGSIANSKQVYVVAAAADGQAVTAYVRSVEGADPVSYGQMTTIAANIADTYAA